MYLLAAIFLVSNCLAWHLAHPCRPLAGKRAASTPFCLGSPYISSSLFSVGRRWLGQLPNGVNGGSRRTGERALADLRVEWREWCAYLHLFYLIPRQYHQRILRTFAVTCTTLYLSFHAMPLYSAANEGIRPWCWCALSVRSICRSLTTTNAGAAVQVRADIQPLLTVERNIDVLACL